MGVGFGGDVTVEDLTVVVEGVLGVADLRAGETSDELDTDDVFVDALEGVLGAEDELMLGETYDILRAFDL